MKWKQLHGSGSYETKVGKFKLSVHRHIHYEPEVWLASCPGVFSDVPLASRELEEAKCQASAKLQVILQAALDDILAEARP